VDIDKMDIDLDDAGADIDSPLSAPSASRSLPAPQLRFWRRRRLSPKVQEPAPQAGCGPAGRAIAAPVGALPAR